MEANRKAILKLLQSKSVLKQDVSEEGQKVFKQLKGTIEGEIAAMREQIMDDRVRLSSQEKGDYELQVMIGSDALIFQLHSNVFCLEDEHPLFQEQYIKDNKDRSFFAVISVYNFLADSFLYNRHNDSGFLIGRIFVNNESHVFVEGKGQLGFLFKDPATTVSSPEVLKHIAQVSFAYALDFDLLAPPYELVEEVSVAQMMVLSSDLQMKTSKRLGFKQSIVKKEQ